MKLILAKWILTCDDEFSIIEDGGIVFSEQIIEVAKAEDLKLKYPEAKLIETKPDSVLLPGLINSHIHLEFLENNSKLRYGDFLTWLDSVMTHREELMEKLNDENLSKSLDFIAKTGTTSLGAISSYGLDLKSCVKSPLNIVYFNEALGSKPEMVDTLFADLKARFENSKAFASSRFFPALAIHSPYSIHPFSTKEVLKIAKAENCAVSAHFCESEAELEWLEKSKGGFVGFFKKFLNQSKSLIKPKEFLEQFKGLSKLSFTHCVQAGKQELEYIKELNASINHCPRSNRLLLSNKLDLAKLEDINTSLGTDGLSSNFSLSLFDELRYSLFVHDKQDINTLAKDLLHFSTKNGAKAIGLDNKGELKKGKDADFILCSLNGISKKEDLALQVILHTKFVKSSYILGEKIV